MNHEVNEPEALSWFEKLSMALLGEPKDISELKKLLRDAEGRDVLDAEALKMIEGVLRVTDLKVEDVMIAKGQMVALQSDMTLDQVMDIIIEAAHSRYPVFDDKRESVVGILLAKDLLGHVWQQSTTSTPLSFELASCLRNAVYVPVSKPLDRLLKEFREYRNHLAVVVDEYGHVAGLVTIEDVLEQIVGDIEDEHDDEDAQYIKAHTDSRYTVKAITPVAAFNEFFNVSFSDEDFSTIGGLVANAFGRLPEPGETIQLGDVVFEVLQTTKRRIELLAVAGPSQSSERPSP